LKDKAKILLIYTGGTIGMVKDYESDTLKPFNFKKLEKNIPELGQLDCSIDSVSFKNPIDSSNMNSSHWVNIAELIESHYDTHDGFVVLHGSDTMSYTAIREVGLYFEYKLYRANRTTKINAEHFEAFASLNYPALAESGVHLKVYEENLLKTNTRKKLKVHKQMNTNVGILKLFPGVSGTIFRSVLATPNLKALILETYGAGNAPTEDWLVEELKSAIKNGIHIINVTQCSGGSVIMGQYETSQQLKKLSIINGKNITTEAAITKLMYLLGSGVSPKLFKTVFETSLRGEMD